MSADAEQFVTKEYLEIRFDQLQNRVDARFNQIDAKIIELEGKIDKVNRTLWIPAIAAIAQIALLLFHKQLGF